MDQDPRSAFVADKRAVAPVIGFILLFAIGIVAFSSYQAFVVPNQNSEVEFNHNSDVQGDMQELRNSLLDVRSVERIEEGEYEKVSEHRSVRVQLGTNYPSRIIALNPPRPTGTLSTEQPEQNFVIEDVDIENPDAFVVDEDEVEDLFEDFEEGEFGTTFLSYQPRYNEYQNAPRTVFEHSLLYNSFRNTDLTVTNQRLIDGKRLNVVLFSGDISRSSSQAITLDPETLDGPTAPIRIEAEDENIEFTLPTNAPGLWKSDNVIGEEFGDGNGERHARITDNETNEVTIELEEDERYWLRAARVGFDGGSVDDERFTPIQYEDPRVGPPGPDPDRFFETLEAEAGGGNIQSVDVSFEILEEADVEIDVTPGGTERFSNVPPNQPFEDETVEVEGNQRPVDVAVSMIDSDTDEQIIRCEGTLDDNGDFLTIDPEEEDSEFDCEE